MTLAAKRTSSLVFFAVAVIALYGSVKYYGFDKQYADMYTEHFGDKLERALKSTAGDDAIACARVTVPRGASISTPCAEVADAEHHNFYASYAVETSDGVVYRGIARNSAGAYTEFTWNPGDHVNWIVLGAKPATVACGQARSLHHTWQGIATCTNEQ